VAWWSGRPGAPRASGVRMQTGGISSSKRSELAQPLPPAQHSAALHPGRTGASKRAPHTRTWPPNISADTRAVWSAAETCCSTRHTRSNGSGTASDSSALHRADGAATDPTAAAVATAAAWTASQRRGRSSLPRPVQRTIPHQQRQTEPCRACPALRHCAFPRCVVGRVFVFALPARVVTPCVSSQAHTHNDAGVFGAL
jgi:hypothetical protein